MEKGTVLILLLLTPIMTKTGQLNDIAIMIYHGGCPVLKYQFLVFCHYFDENHMKEMKMKKRNCIIIETNDKKKSTKWNPIKMFSDAYSVPNCLSRLRLEGVFSWTVSICYNKLPFFRGNCVQFESRQV